MLFRSEECTSEEETTEECTSEEEITEECTLEEETTEECTLEEEITEECTLEEELTEEETSTELEFELMAARAYETPESDFTWNGTTIIKYNGTAKNVVIPEKAYIIGSQAFLGNRTIESVTIGKNVMQIDARAFSDCSNLHTVKFETVKIKREGGCGYQIFDGCNIKKVEFAENTTYIPAGLFRWAGFQNGAKITIPQKVTSIGGEAFYYAKNLSMVSFEGNNLVEIGSSAFWGTAIKSIHFPESLKTIGGAAFFECRNIEKIEIPKNVTVVGEKAFYNCSALSTVKIRTIKANYGFGVFCGCNISKIELPEDLTIIPDSMFSSADFQGGTEITIPANVTSIGNYAFYCVDNLCKVTFTGDKVAQIGDSAFAGTSIQSIDLPKNLRTIGGQAFFQCKNLTEVEIPEKVTKIERKAFQECIGLTTVKINATNPQCDYGIFIDCNINYVEFSENMEWIPDLLFAGADFQGGTEVVIPENVTAIGSSAFYGVNNLCKVIFAGNKVTQIGREAFYGTSIETINLPEGLQEISYGTFCDCTSLQEITIPNKVKKIYNTAFMNCKGLNKVVLPASVTSLEYNTFGNVYNAKYYVVKDSYAYNWAKEKGYTIVESFNITYNLNGGINASGNPTAYEKGESLTFNNPTREGYTFVGWYADSSCTKKFEYTTSKTGNLVLYAKWKNNIYNITYKLNGGTLAQGSPVTYTTDAIVTLKNPTKQGYLFTGWYTDAKCTEDNKITKLEKGSAGDKTLYAGWKEYSYTIHFAPNHATVSGMQESMTDCAYSKKVTLPKCVYTRPGYEFAGWNTMANGKGTSYADKETVSKLVSGNNASITLYAIWKEKTYTITYKLNGGTNHAKNPDSYTVTKNIALSNPTREGYTFKGWYTDVAYKNKITAIQKGSSQNVTVYAKWEANKYNVSFHGNGGTGRMTNLTGCEYDKSYTLTQNAYTRNGYTFKGWNTNAKGTGTWYWNGSSVKNLVSANNKTVTLYAIWTENTYSITYHLNGGTNHAKNAGSYATVRGLTLSNPTREGYTFKGWYTDKAYTNKLTAIKKGSSENVTVYAKWEVNKYNVSFHANGGSGKMTNLTSCEYDKSYTLTQNAYTRNGYTFKGWNTNAKGTGTWYWNASNVKNLTSANNKTITLYAIWVKK